MGRINKGLRLPQDLLARAAHLRSYHPEYETEAAMLNAMLYRGLLILEVEALLGGGAPPSGYTTQQIVAMALPKILPALQFMMKMGVLPLPIAAGNGGAEGNNERVEAEEAIDMQTSEELGRLGSHFL